MSIKIKIRLLLLFVLVGTIVFLFWMAIVPFGKIAYELKANKHSDFLSKFSPDTRAVNAEDYFKIIGDPIYFNLRVPRNFEKAKLIVKYKRKNISSPIIEVGILADQLLWRYNLKPLENTILDDFLLYEKSPFPGWENMDVLRAENLVLIQKEKKYFSIKDFLADPPPIDQIAVYNYDLKTDYILPDYQADPEGIEISYKIQGAFQFYTYIKNENLDFKFQYRDLNKNKSEDPIDLLLYYENNLIHSAGIGDDGIAEDSGQESALREAVIDAENLPEGVYKIEFKANDDIVIENIKTGQQKISFINRLNFFSEEKNIKLFTSADEIKLKVVDPAYLQTVKFGDKELELEKTYSQFSILKSESSDSDLIELEKGGLILEGRGVFYFKEDQLIYPSIVQLDSSRSINDDIRYILADYIPPFKNGEWVEAQAEFDLSKAFSENKKYSFLFSIPGLRADDEIDDWLEISEIKIELEGKSLFDKIKGTVANSRIRSKLPNFGKFFQKLFR